MEIKILDKVDISILHEVFTAYLETRKKMELEIGDSEYELLGKLTILLA